MAFVAGQKVRASDLNALVLTSLWTWTSYTMTWASSGTQPAIGNGTKQGAYVVIGKTCFFRINVLMGSTTTYGTGTYTFSLPFTAKTLTGTSTLPAWAGSAMCIDSGTAYTLGILSVTSAATTCGVLQHATGSGFWSNTIPQTWANGDYLALEGCYELA